MEREVAKDLFAACEKTIAALTEAEYAIRRITDEPERKRLFSALSRVIVEVLSNVRAPVVRQYPELEPPEELGPPDTELSTQEQEVVSQLSSVDVQVIDKALLSECASSWRKVARVVSAAMTTLRDRFPSVPDGYYAQRVATLVSSGSLEAQGNLNHMRFSEVRLASSHSSAA